MNFHVYFHTTMRFTKDPDLLTKYVRKLGPAIKRIPRVGTWVDETYSYTRNYARITAVSVTRDFKNKRGSSVRNITATIDFNDFGRYKIDFKFQRLTGTKVVCW
jgi:hypothetical protein